MKKLTMEDVGTRLDHLADLYDMWNEGLTIAENSEKRHSTPMGAAQVRELQHAVQLLWYHMTTDYDSFQYSTVIARLPKAPGIVGGRGTELRQKSIEEIIGDNDIT